MPSLHHRNVASVVRVADMRRQFRDALEIQRRRKLLLIGREQEAAVVHYLVALTRLADPFVKLL